MPGKFLHEKIPYSLSVTASYDPTTDMYKLIALYPAHFLEPFLSSNSHLQITIPSKDIRARKDALVRLLLEEIS